MVSGTSESGWTGIVIDESGIEVGATGIVLIVEGEIVCAMSERKMIEMTEIGTARIGIRGIEVIGFESEVIGTESEAIESEMIEIESEVIGTEIEVIGIESEVIVVGGGWIGREWMASEEASGIGGRKRRETRR